MRGVSILVLLLMLHPATRVAQDGITQEAFEHGGRTRTFFVYSPDTTRAGGPAPVLIALHDSGRDGASIVNPWKDLARKEGLVIVGPNADDRVKWTLQNDGPDFFNALVTIVRAHHHVDPRRMYLFGHSAGAIQGFMIGLLESEYFAAVAIHAGALPKESDPRPADADRESRPRLLRSIGRGQSRGLELSQNTQARQRPALQGVRPALKTADGPVLEAFFCGRNINEPR